MKNLEIVEASIDYQISKHPVCIGGDNFAEDARKLNVNQSFIDGAKWMKQHLIEEITEWFTDTIHDTTDVFSGKPYAICNWMTREEFIEGFKQFIENE